MEDKIKKIIEMSKEGKSYTATQTELKVSPARISQIRHKYAEEINAAKNAAKKDEKTYLQSENHPDTPKSPDKSENFESPLVTRINKLENLLTQSREEMKNKENKWQMAREREKDQTDEENQRLREISEETFRKLNEKISYLEDEVYELRTQRQEKEVVKADVDAEIVDDEYDDPVYHKNILKLLTELLKKGEKLWGKNKTKKVLENIYDLKERFQKICEADKTDVNDFDDWDILNILETSFSGILKKVDWKTTTSKIIIKPETKGKFNTYLKAKYG